MITLLDLKTSINNILKETFGEIRLHASEVEEGFEKPSFFTRITPIVSRNESWNRKKQRILVVILYFEEEQTEIGNLKMIDKLNDAFGMTLEVKANDGSRTRHLLLNDVEVDFPDGILQFRFVLDYYLNVERIDEHEEMGELEFRIIKED